MSIIPSTTKASKYFFDTATRSNDEYSNNNLKKELENNEFTKCLSIVLVRKGEDFFNLRTAVDSVVRDAHPSLPLSVVSKDGKSVIVYPNLTQRWDHFYNARYILNRKYLLPLFRQYKADLEDERKAARWSETSRGFKFILKRENMSFAKFLSKYVLKGKGYKDDQIRDMGEQLEAEFQEPEVVFCEKPEDYSRMYECGQSSCMLNSPLRRTGLTKEIYDKYGLYPTMWYHFNPHTKGVFALRKGKPVVRAFIIDGKFYSQYFYSDSGSYSAKLQRHLNSLGLQPGGYGTRITQEFRIPAVETSVGPVGPIPHCDDIAKPFGVAYDAKTNEFVYGPSKKEFTKIDSTYAYPGWIRAENCARV